MYPDEYDGTSACCTTVAGQDNAAGAYAPYIKIMYALDPRQCPPARRLCDETARLQGWRGSASVRGVTEAKKEVVWWGYDEVKLEVEEHRDGDGDGDAKHMERFTELRRSCSSEGRP